MSWRVAVLLWVGFTCAGCIQVHRKGWDGTEYLAIENGLERKMHVVWVESHSAIVVGAARFDTALVDTEPAADDKSALRLVRDQTPQHRDLEYLTSRISQVIDDGKKATAPVVWIVSVDPLVIAIGTEITKNNSKSFDYLGASIPVQLPGTQRLVKNSDLNAEVESLTVLELSGPRALKLSSRMTIGELLKNQPWAR